jgi:hypothetical protein
MLLFWVLSDSSVEAVFLLRWWLIIASNRDSGVKNHWPRTRPSAPCYSFERRQSSSSGSPTSFLEYHVMLSLTLEIKYTRLVKLPRHLFCWRELNAIASIPRVQHFWEFLVQFIPVDTGYLSPWLDWSFCKFTILFPNKLDTSLQEKRFSNFINILKPFKN